MSNLKQKLSVLVLAFALVAFTAPLTLLHAQDMETETATEADAEAEINDTTASDEETEEMEEDAADTTTDEEVVVEATEGEIPAEYADAEVVTEADVAEEPVIGEVVAVSDEEMVIETVDGDLVSIPATADVQVNGRRILGTGSARPVVGDRAVVAGIATTLTTGVVVTNENGVLTIRTADGQELVYRSNANTVVAQDDNTAGVEDIDEGDEITVVVDEEGEILGVDINEEADADATDEDGGFPWVWVLVVIAALLIIWQIATSRKA